MKTTLDEGGDVYLAYSSTHVDHEAWLIDSSVSFHMTLHREWFCEYDKYDGGDVLLSDDRKTIIIRRGKFKLKLTGGSIKTLLSILHTPRSTKNIIFVSKMDGVRVKTMFEKDIGKMV